MKTVGDGGLMRIGGDGGVATSKRRRGPGGEDGNGLMAQTKSSPVQTAHGGVEGGKSQDGVVVADGIWGTTEDRGQR